MISGNKIRQTDQRTQDLRTLVGPADSGFADSRWKAQVQDDIQTKSDINFTTNTTENRQQFDVTSPNPIFIMFL